MGSLDVFLADIATSDTKKKLQIGESIVNYLGNPDNSIGTSQLSSVERSVGDLDLQDPHVFEPPVSGSISQRYGSGSGSGTFLFS
jgi:hypothetical protein